MSGAVDPLYVRARAALLDALDALEAHLDALVLVGAQAVYLHTSDTDLAVGEYTTDAGRVAIRERVVDADAEAGGAERVRGLAQQIAPAR